jgi:formamidopyrimidine-DNA glycosylase
MTKKGGRNDEVDLLGNPGGYVRIMDSRAAGKPCPECGATVQKIHYLGGACYFCPKCQS